MNFFSPIELEKYDGKKISLEKKGYDGISVYVKGSRYPSSPPLLKLRKGPQGTPIATCDLILNDKTHPTLKALAGRMKKQSDEVTLCITGDVWFDGDRKKKNGAKAYPAFHVGADANIEVDEDEQGLMDDDAAPAPAGAGKPAASGGGAARSGDARGVSIEKQVALKEAIETAKHLNAQDIDDFKGMVENVFPFYLGLLQGGGAAPSVEPAPASEAEDEEEEDEDELPF